MVKTHTRKLLTIPVRLGLALLIVALAAPSLTAGPSIEPGERGSITISTMTNPAGGQGLKFGGDLGSFALDDGAFRQFKDLEAGEYYVYEKAPEGWTLDKVICKDDAGEEHDVKDDYAGGDRNGVAVKLGPGEHIACIFYNSKDAGTILDQPAPAGGTGLEFNGGPNDSALSPAATTTVDTTVDELDGHCDDGDCSLRDAILLADPGDTIVIPAGTYTLALGHLVVDKDLTLAGAGADTTIIQAAAEPNVANLSVVEVYQANGTITVGISGLTLRHGGGPDDVDPGGGLMNYGENVILSHSTVAFNSGYYAGGIHNDGGSMIIQNCAVYGNTEGSNAGGGGIYNDGAMTITNSTISGNQVLSFDGERADGGGIRHVGGSLTLDNVTVAGNVSTRYGGGVFASPGLTVTVRNSIIAGNFSLDTITPTMDCSGPFYSAGYNLIGDDTGCTGFTDGVNGDRVGVDPLLAALADNGGPTPTHALYDGSPAIDNGSCSDAGGNPVTADQRGISRPQGSGCDVGAFESGPPDLVISKSVAPTTAAPGQAVTYTLTFSNAGVGIATGIVITDIVPVTITGVSAISSGVAIVDPGAVPPYVLQVRELAALNRGGVITITGMVSPGLSVDCVFTNTATITTAVAEQNLADNRHQVPLGVVVPRVRFSGDAYDVSEGDGATVITVTLDAPNVYAGVTVSYTTTDGTAVAGEDYTATGGNITIPAGSTFVTFSVTIADDQVDEAAETVLLSLSDPSGGALDAPSDATLTILDNDSRVYLPLVARSYTTSE